jgi:hypothetical protein
MASIISVGSPRKVQQLIVAVLVLGGIEVNGRCRVCGWFVLENTVVGRVWLVSRICFCMQGDVHSYYTA